MEEASKYKYFSIFILSTVKIERVSSYFMVSIQPFVFVLLLEISFPYISMKYSF